MKTNISGTFSLESKNKKVSKKNLVVKSGINQLFNWFKLSDYAQEPKHIPYEKTFSNYGIERITWNNSKVSTNGKDWYGNVDENIINSFSNISAIVDGWDNSALTSNYSTTNRRSIKITFKDKESNNVGLNLKGFALYGKRTSNYNSNVSYTGEVVLTRKSPSGTIAKKTFQTPILLSPYRSSNDKITFEKNNDYWAGGRFYVYFTFEELFNPKKWEVEENNENYDFQQNASQKTPYLKDIYEIEIIDRYNGYIQINEVDIYTYRNNVFYNSPSFFKIGTGKSESNLENEDLESPIDEKIMIEDVYLTEERKVRYVGYIPEEKYNNLEISEVGIFFEQDGEEKLFARTVLEESFIIPNESFVRIVYDLEVE